MALYEYRCTECGCEITTERMPDGMPCELPNGDGDCRGELKRVYSAPAIVWPKSERGH